MLDLTPLDHVSRLLMAIPLRPIQGDRFQPTGFPSLGAATYQTSDGKKLLVESAQSMANRFELTCWETAQSKPISALDGISHVTVKRGGKFLTDSMLEPHRLSSPYILSSSDRSFLDPFLDDMRAGLGQKLIDENQGLVSRTELAKVILKYDIGSLVHGVFFANNKVKLQASGKPSSIAGGRLRISRALSSFIEATDARVAASGGVKNDSVHPEKVSGELSELTGNVPFARDEYVAAKITLFVNLDLAQIRGYGLGNEAERLLILLALFKVRKAIDGDLRLRTACDLTVDRDAAMSVAPESFSLPPIDELIGTNGANDGELQKAVHACRITMLATTATFDDEIKKAKDEKKAAGDNEGNGDDDTDSEGDD